MNGLLIAALVCSTLAVACLIFLIYILKKPNESDTKI
jgi:hypothetical protein